MCTPCALLPAPRLITGTSRVSVRYWHTSSLVTSAHDRETARVHHGHCIVNQFFRAVSCFPLCKKSAQLRHAHGCDTDVPLDRYTRFDNRFDVFGMVLIAFALHHFGIRLCATNLPAFSTACSAETCESSSKACRPFAARTGYLDLRPWP